MYAEKKILLLFFKIFIAISLLGQCPSNDSLWNKLTFLSAAKTISFADKLNELSKIEAKIKNCPGISDSTRAFLLMSVGRNNYKNEDYLKAIQYELRALDILNTGANKSSVNPKYKIDYYYFLSVAYDSLHRAVEEIKAIDSCIKVAIRLHIINTYCLAALSTAAEYYYDIGDYNRCIDYATTCEKFGAQYSTTGGQQEQVYGSWYESNGFSWRVNALLALKDYDLSEKLLTNKLNEYEKNGLKNYLGFTYWQLGEIEVNKKNYTQALSYYNQALIHDKEDKANSQCKMVLNNIGLKIYFVPHNDYTNAFAYYRKALSFSSKDVSDAIESIPVYVNIAVLFAKEKSYDSAFKYFQFAFDKIKPGLTEEDLLHISLNEFNEFGKIYYLTDLLLNKGQVILQKYYSTKQKKDIIDAVRFYKITDQIFDRIKTEQSEEKSKLFWRNTARNLYEYAIDACYNLGNTEDAFYFFEKSRAVLLNDQLKQHQWINENDISKLGQLQKKIIQLESKLKLLPSSAKQYDSLQTDIFNRKEELIRLEELIKTQNPLYYQNFIDTAKINLQNARQNLLKDHQVFLELFNGDSSLYTLTITPVKTILNKIDKADFDSTNTKLISFISKAALLNSHYYEFNKTAHYLYQLIFGKDDLPNGRLIISPDGQYFPFEALVTNSNFQSPVYFLNDHAVSYTYSARFLMNDFSVSNTSSKNNFLGIAPVKYVSSLLLPALNGSDQSLNEIENYFSGTGNYISDQATKTNFTNQFSKYKVIQLYTHSSDTSARNEPVIFFQDSALYLSELIPENKPSSQLIVLSACETANGQLYRGEGVFSFNRGFAALGIPSSVTNLWSVDDKSTYKITELFYKYLAKGLPLDVALQNAKKEFIQTGSKENSLPYYWAAPVLVGKTDAIELSNKLSRKIFFLSAAVCLLIFFAVKYFVRKKILANKNLQG
ncbi:MAG TPA: CHAT domain-containing protein [Puia sp.]|nr:CHAT domain-containing protein [Puia sp.]